MTAIKRAEALLKAASPGPWRNESGVIHAPLPNGGAHHPLTVYEGPYFLGDPIATGDLAALTPDLLRGYISAVKALEAAHDFCRQALQVICTVGDCQSQRAIADFERLFPEESSASAD